LQKNYPSVWQKLNDPSRSVQQKTMDFQGGAGWGYLRPAAGAANSQGRINSALRFMANPPQGGQDPWSGGASAIPYSDWLTNASTRNLMRQSNITTNNNRTSSETTV